jgi:Transposase IS116/IS110/IS902 family
MRFYTRQHVHYCGIDLHARSLYLCILDQEGKTLVHRKLPCEREQLMKTLAPYRKDLVVAVECLFCWYWVADLTLLYKIHDLSRFPRVQDFLSYARLVKGTHESAGKTKKLAGGKMGNVHLKWAFSEAAALFLRGNPIGQKYFARLEKKHGKGKALSILAAKLGRAVYYMLLRHRPFELQRFVTT